MPPEQQLMLVFRNSRSMQSVTYLLLNSLISEFSALYKAESSAAQNKEVPAPNTSRDEPRYEALDVWEEAMSCLMRHSAKKQKGWMTQVGWRLVTSERGREKNVKCRQV